MAQLQQRGLLAVVICTENFVPLGKASAAVFKAPDLPLIVIDHPLGGVSLDAVKARAAQALPQLVELLRKHANS